MKALHFWRRLTLLVLVPVMLALFVLPARLQGEDAKKEKSPTAKSTDKKAAGKKPSPRKKPRGRLPAYYDRVVSLEQRAKIYAIQRRHAPQIKKLQQELRELTKNRNAEVQAVLTAEQREKVAALAAAAKAKRKKAAAERKKKTAKQS